MPTDTSLRRPVATSDRTPRRGARKLTLSEKAASLVLLALVSLGVLTFGASDVATATVLAGLQAAFLIGLLVFCGWARRDIAGLGGLSFQASSFVLLIVAVLWPLTPWGPGGAHPVWAYRPGEGGSLTVDRSALLLNVLQLLGLACLFVVGRVIGASKARGIWLMQAALVALGVYAGAALVDHVVVRRSARLTATLLSPNSAATVFGTGALLAVAAAVNRFRRFSGLTVLKQGDPAAVAWLCLVGLQVTTLLLTVSRAGVMTTLAGLGLLLTWNAFARKQGLRATAGMLMIAAAPLVAAIALRGSEQLVDRLTSTGRDLEIRSLIFTAHWQAFLSTPWSGFGLGAFPTVNHLIATGPNLSVLHDIRAAHNLYLQWLEEGGVIGSSAMLLVFLGLVWPILRGTPADGSAGVWARATVCAALVVLVHGVTDFALQVPAIQALCALVLGVVGSMAAARAGNAQADKGPWLALAGTGAGVTRAAAVLAGGPMVAGRLGADLSSWPTAPAEALARSIEAGLAAPGRDEARLARLARISDRELSLRPASGSGWLRRAVIQADLGNDGEASSALERSFMVAPLQTSLFDHRTVFAYEHWDRLSPAAREQAAYHLRAEWRRSGRPAKFIAMANTIRNPAGRVGMALQIAALRLAAHTAR
jgi:O-antigen ligase